MVTENINIDVRPGGIPIVIHVTQYEVGLRKFVFTPYTSNGTQTVVAGSATLEGTKPDGYAFQQACEMIDGVITYTLQEQLCAVEGRVWSRLVIRDTDGGMIGYTAIVWVVGRAGVADDAVMSDSDISALRQFLDEFGGIDAYRGALNGALAAVGGPLVAATASAMTDTTKVYVYTGSESGYTEGHWYYWNGSAWTDGGVYQSTGINTDKTLTVEDMAADAKATGDAVAELKNDLNSELPEYNPFLNATVLYSLPYYCYTAKTTSDWQGNLPPQTFDASEGDTFTVMISSYHGVGRQKVRLQFQDSSNAVISSHYITIDSNGNGEKTVTAPANTAKVVLDAWVISNGGTVIVGETYYFRNLYLFKGNVSLKNVIIPSAVIKNDAINYAKLSNNVKPYYISLRYGVKYPNFDTTSKTLTFYSGTCIFDRNGTEIYRSTADIVVNCNTGAQQNVIAFDRANETFVAVSPLANTKSDNYIIFGIIQIAGSSVYPFGRGWIGIPHTIDDYDPYIKAPDPMWDLPSAWQNAVEPILEAKGSKFTFAIQTDTHYYLNQNEYYGNNLKALTNHVGFDFVANLGDVIQGYANETIDSNENMRASMTQLMKRYVTGISCPLMIAMGNHDTNSMWANAFSGTPFTFAEVWGRMFKPSFNTNPKAVTNTGLMYYYTDFNDVRVIVLNTQDGPNGGFGVGQTQIDWFTNTALNTNKAVLVMSHVPLVNGWSVNSNYTPSYANIVTALQSFKANGGTVIGCMSGHTHTQESKTVDDILYVTFRNQANLAEVVMVDIENKIIETISVGFSGNRSFAF